MTPVWDADSKLWARTVRRALRDVAVGQVFKYGPAFGETFGQVTGRNDRGVAVDIMDSSRLGGLRAETLSSSITVEIPYGVAPLSPISEGGNA